MYAINNSLKNTVYTDIKLLIGRRKIFKMTKDQLEMTIKEAPCVPCHTNRMPKKKRYSLPSTHSSKLK